MRKWQCSLQLPWFSVIIMFVRGQGCVKEDGSIRKYHECQGQQPEQQVNIEECKPPVTSSGLCWVLIVKCEHQNGLTRLLSEASLVKTCRTFLSPPV